MDPRLNQLGAQLVQIWKQLGINQRVSVVLATGAVLAALAGLGFWSTRVHYGLLYGRLPEAEAARVVAALDEAKIPYQVSAGGGSVMVPASQVHVARMQLATKGIPRGDGVGFEIFDKPNFGISDFVQRANFIRALQGELARTISQFDEIETARVMVVLPENRLLMDKDKHPTASVFVRVRGNQALPTATVNAIRFLVANGVEGLKANHVTLVDNQGNVLSENSDHDSISGLSATQLMARQNLEQYLARKAEGMLEKVLGPGQAIVRVAAEINFDTVTRTEEVFDPESQVVRTQTKNEENNDTTTANQTEAAGLVANLVADTNGMASASGPLNNTRNRKTTSTVEYELSRTNVNVVQSAGGLKRLSAAVTVAARHEGEGAARKAVPRTPEEVEKLRRIVQSALGTDTTRGDQITLEELPFNDQFAVEVSGRLDRQQRWDFWWGLARGGMYPALALVVLLVLFRVFKRTRVEELTLGLPSSAMGYGPGNGHGPRTGPGEGRHPLHPDWPGEGSPGYVTVEVLNQLIKENPGNMTQAIRNWLTRGGSPPK